MIGHPLRITTRCACTKVSEFTPEYMVERMGRDVTLRIAAGRLRCQACHQRPQLLVDYTYAAHPARDTRRDPAPLPGWVVPLLERES
jgi:hypothetical protein